MFNTKISENLMVAFCFCITLALHLLIFNHYFSLQEGWWETYAYLVNRGEVINKDFYLAWTPLFVYINAFYQKIFGINFFAFACIGVVAAMIQVILLYLVLREFFSKPASAIAALFATLLSISSGTYIAKDYHTYVYIMEFATLLFLIKYVKNKNTVKGKVYHAIGALFCVLLFFIKQNVGLVLFASLFVSYAFIINSLREYFKKILFWLFCVIVFFFIVNLFIPFNLSSIADNDSKGSIYMIATRFLTNNLNQEILLKSIGLFVILVLGHYLSHKIEKIYLLAYNKVQVSITKSFKIFLLILIHAIFIYILIYIITKAELSINWFVVASISIVLFIFYLFFRKNKIIFSKKEYVFMALSMTAISYAGTLADAFTTGGNMICIAFASSFILDSNLQKQIKLFFVYAHFILIYFMCSNTIETPYNWNFNNQTNVFKANSESLYKQLNGIYMDERTAYIFDYFNDYVKNKSTTERDFYFFNLPIMYLLNNKIPPYYLVTHWLDVASSKAIDREYNEFLKAPAKNIVIYQYQTYFFLVHKVYQGKKTFRQTDFIKTMNKWVKEGKYKFVKSIIVPYDNNTYEDNKKQILKNLMIILQNEKFFGMNRIEFKQWLKENGVTLTDIKRDAIINMDENAAYEANNKDIMQNGDILLLEGTVADLCDIFPILGVAPAEVTFVNTINIYEKQGDWNE